MVDRNDYRLLLTPLVIQILWSSNVFALDKNRNDKIVFRASEWSNWTSWSKCSEKRICYSGSRVRSRSCVVEPCVGLYVENKDCPTQHCEEDTENIVLDITEATFSSFISQECDVDMKHSFDTSKVPVLISKMFERYLPKFQKGYFNRKFLIGKTEIKLRNMTKYCFQPYKMTIGEALSIGRFNRSSRSSLVASEYRTHVDNYIAGITLVLDSMHIVVASYFAVPSTSAIGYRHVYYHRWEGVGLEEFL